MSRLKVDAARRKRLGQFFSGVALGRLLAGLTDVQGARSIIDPMAGTGDLLQACLDLGATPDDLVGIELDENASSLAIRRLPAARVIKGDAFAPETIALLPRTAYDLVIANPPYVRYQESGSACLGIPSSVEVRTNLISSTELFAAADRGHAEIIGSLARDYSGLADLAVPACLLSMLMVAPGGELALVLPQAWLARDYASPVRFALETLFDPVVVIEDENASWFDEALVRTTLIVAQRSHPAFRDRRLGPSPAHVRLGSQLTDHRSLVGAIEPASDRPELVFGDLVRRFHPDTVDRLAAAGVSVRMVSSLNRSTELSAQPLPDELNALLGNPPSDLVGMGDLPISIGQGLRTGANDFFYVDASTDLSKCRTSYEIGQSILLGMDDLLRPAVRDQRSAARQSGSWHDAVLDLRSVALPEDISSNGPATRAAYRPMSEGLADHVRRAASVLSGKPGRERPVAKLSAVATNARPERAGRPARFWYQLPDMQPRHRPDVYMARVNAGRPQAVINEGRSRLIDANFITFVCDDHSSAASLAAALNSDWVWAYLELVGAVMGGGALKIESTMLKRLPLPTFVTHATQSPLVNSGFDRMLQEQIGSKAMRAIGELARARWAARTRQHLRGAA
jgi:hypothetical protein